MTVRLNEGSVRELRDALVQAMSEVDRAATAFPSPAVRLLSAVEDEDDGDPNVH